ncbi:12304_t:CDS:2 [Ambispora leptoticha]|uniref:12304_t:CDS:1 n=1 Tax=Ambispora leptoticha TaxID=144679 RepID=A0A9N9C1Z5_9GLOM|nr:12304_t:CDS:2 [Ambispora leptoticha]
MSHKQDVATQTLPNHTVERISTISLTSDSLKPPNTASSSSSQPRSFYILKVTCIQQIQYNVQLPPKVQKLCESDIDKMEVTIIDGKLFSLNSKKENLILKRMCRSEIWKKFGFSNISPIVEQKRQYNKRYWVFAFENCCVPHASDRRPFGTLSQLTFAFNWVATDILVDSMNRLSLRKKLESKKREFAALEIMAIDIAFRSLMRNLLVERYPLIFSPTYQTKLETITKYIPDISNSLTNIIQNSPNAEFQSKTAEYIEEIRNNLDLSLSTTDTQISIKDLLGDALYTAANNLKVPTVLFRESSSEEEVSNDDYELAVKENSHQTLELRSTKIAEPQTSSSKDEIIEIVEVLSSSFQNESDDEEFNDLFGNESSQEIIKENNDNESIFDFIGSPGILNMKENEGCQTRENMDHNFWSSRQFSDKEHEINCTSFDDFEDIFSSDEEKSIRSTTPSPLLSTNYIITDTSSCLGLSEQSTTSTNSAFQRAVSVLMDRTEYYHNQCVQQQEQPLPTAEDDFFESMFDE